MAEEYHEWGTRPLQGLFSPRARLPPPSANAQGRPIYTCRTCQKTFLHQCNLFRHRKKCEGDYHLACHLCGKRFYRRDYYQEHLAIKHNTVDVLKGSFKSKF
ncbi:hypothetical protein ACOMHN_036020 [Nucella lapillus]